MKKSEATPKTSASGTATSAGQEPCLIITENDRYMFAAGTWQRTFARGDYALATCVVSPEFTFDDWMLAEAN